MNESELEARKTLRKRQRQAAERLLDNSSLRDALTDEQGQQLLDWGLAQAKAAAGRTAKLPEAEADPALDDQVTAVSDVMRQVNRLVELWPSASEADIQSNVKKLLAGLRAVRQTALTTSQSEIVENLARVGKERDAAAAFTDLMRLLNEMNDQSSSEPAPTSEAKEEQARETAAPPTADDTPKPEAKETAAEPVQEEKEEGIFDGLRRFVGFGRSRPAETDETNEEN